MSERTKTPTGRLMWWEQLGTRSWGLGVAADILSLEERLAKLESHAARCPMGIDCPGPADESAVPAARAPEPEPEPAARRRPAGGTGDTPVTQTTPGEGSVTREGTEPVAWAVLTADGTAVLHTSCTKQGSMGYKRMMERQGEVVALYRKATLTDAERVFLHALRNAYEESANQTGCVNAAAQADSRKNAATLRGLLKRLGGGR